MVHLGLFTGPPASAWVTIAVVQSLSWVRLFATLWTAAHQARESACDAGDTGDMGSIPGSGKSSGEGMATHSCILA